MEVPGVGARCEGGHREGGGRNRRTIIQSGRGLPHSRTLREVRQGFGLRQPCPAKLSSGGGSSGALDYHANLSGFSDCVTTIHFPSITSVVATGPPQIRS